MFLLSSLFVLLLILFDQAAKYYVFAYFTAPYKLNNYVLIDLSINRGVSWGLLSFSNNVLFAMVTMLVCFILGFLALYTQERRRNNRVIIGELFVLAGGISNLLDRVVYRGVVDFISMSVAGWYWPTFNIADCFIVLGVIIMVVTFFNES